LIPDYSLLDSEFSFQPPFLSFPNLFRNLSENPKDSSRCSRLTSAYTRLLTDKYLTRGNLKMVNDAKRPLDDLGQQLREYKTRVGNYWFLIVTSACVFAFLLIVMWAEAKNQRDLSEDAWIFVGIGALGLVPIAILIYQTSNVARFYELGVVYENRRSVKTANWAEICDVWEWCARVNVEGMPMPNQLFYAIRTVDGMIIRFPPRLDNIVDLGRFLKLEAGRWGVPIRSGVPPMKYSLVNLAGSRK
jgi:hypothetical protein